MQMHAKLWEESQRAQGGWEKGAVDMGMNLTHQNDDRA